MTASSLKQSLHHLGRKPSNFHLPRIPIPRLPSLRHLPTQCLRHTRVAPVRSMVLYMAAAMRFSIWPD